MALITHIQEIIGQSVIDMKPLHGGMIGEVYVAYLADGERVVVKVDQAEEATLHIEGQMLQYLKDHTDLPVPDVLFSSPELLIMSFIDGQSRFSSTSEHHAAELLANLHSHHAETYGLPFDTLIGSLHQPNQPTDSWIDFFKEQRLLYIMRVAYDAGKLAASTRQQIEQLAKQLDELLIEPQAPALIHGDAWTTNVLASQDHISGFLDPAIYYAHPEIELAFISLFNTFGKSFFERYKALNPIADGFFDVRRDIYNLYPLLVHVRLFGGGYESSVRRILSRYV